MKIIYLEVSIINLLQIVNGNAVDNAAHAISITFPNGDNIHELPLLSGVNVDTKQKIHAIKTPIQQSSEAFSLDVFCVSITFVYVHIIQFGTIFLSNVLIIVIID